ncbi:MAG: AbrB/MazE/SpoVT family DNA-binding domain-containing protein [Candidatus Aenigmarchaeota archaeon]|nr:AbrB/MazE/SpoVT family DNA-binding domain-containing protein [Candidatus Aenigmarchaeota archaeon]
MEISITRMSQNGQIVIPAEIRKDAKIKPRTKFLVFNDEGEILLKPIKEGMLMEEISLISRIESSEREIEEGRVVRADSKMSVKEIDDLLMS